MGRQKNKEHVLQSSQVLKSQCTTLSERTSSSLKYLARGNRLVGLISKRRRSVVWGWRKTLQTINISHTLAFPYGHLINPNQSCAPRIKTKPNAERPKPTGQLELHLNPTRTKTTHNPRGLATHSRRFAHSTQQHVSRFQPHHISIIQNRACARACLTENRCCALLRRRWRRWKHALIYHRAPLNMIQKAHTSID